MAPRKKDSATALCDKAVTLGNTIAIRMMEYFSTGKHQVQGFRELSNDFLDVGRILWSIEIGLKASGADSAQKLPADMIVELEKRFRQTHDDFILLLEIVTRFLENDKKTGFGKFAKGFKMMFADSRVDKMRASLQKTREALKMSALVFRWSMGDQEIDSTIGMGYTGLAAVLDRLNGNSISAPGSTARQMTQSQAPPPRAPPPPTPSVGGSTAQAPPPQVALPDPPRAQSLQPHHYGHEDGLGFSVPPALPALSVHERSRSPQSVASHRFAPSQRAEDMHDLHGMPERTPTIRSDRSSKGMNHSLIRELTTSELSMAQSTGLSTVLGDSASTHTAETDTMLEDLLSEADLSDHKSPGQLSRVTPDMATVPRWEPRFLNGAEDPRYKTALVHAVQRKSHSTMEQLLNQGVSPDSVTNVHLLREAIINKDTDAIRILLLYKADPNSLDKYGCTPLFSATEQGLTDAAVLLIKYGADPNMSAGPNADTPLAIAVLENRFELVKLFLRHGADPNRIMANGNTVLIRSIDRKTPKALVELMLEHGIDVNSKNAEGTSPMFQCVSTQRLDIAHMLLDRGADPNLPGPKHLLWPSAYQAPFLRLLLSRGADHHKAPGIMELATSVNNIESVRILLNSGVDPNAKKDGVYTPLCSAIRDNRPDIFSLLLANGADPNVSAAEYPCFKCVTHQRAKFLPQLIAAGGDPNEPRGILEKAVLHNNQDALIFLLDYGVNVNAKSAEGYTPLTTAIRENRTEMVDLLLARGADPSVRGQDWPVNMAVKRPHILKKILPSISNPKNFKGVVEMAVCADQLESIKLLLSAGFSVEDKNGGVFSPLTSAIRERNTEVVRYLIDQAGANINAPGEHLPIIKALRRLDGKDTEVLELLLARGADINQMYRGWNAVLQAVENGDADILDLLVRKGNAVDLDQTDENDQTVLDVVKGHGWDEAVQILTQGGRR